MASWRDTESDERAQRREQNEATHTAFPAPAGVATCFRCECGDGRCSCAITMTPSEYAIVRAYATHFAIARNHENPESEQVIEEKPHFAVVETVTGDATKLARRSDPRQRQREERWAEEKPSVAAEAVPTENETSERVVRAAVLGLPPVRSWPEAGWPGAAPCNGTTSSSWRSRTR